MCKLFNCFRAWRQPLLTESGRPSEESAELSTSESAGLSPFQRPSLPPSIMAANSADYFNQKRSISAGSNLSLNLESYLTGDESKVGHNDPALQRRDSVAVAVQESMQATSVPDYAPEYGTNTRSRYFCLNRELLIFDPTKKKNIVFMGLVSTLLVVNGVVSLMDLTSRNKELEGWELRAKGLVYICTLAVAAVFFMYSLLGCITNATTRRLE